MAGILRRNLGEKAVLFNDLSVPGTRGNVDHLVVAPTGVWVVDAKNYNGRVERRDVGGLFRVDDRLFVGGRDKTQLVSKMGWQVSAVGRVVAPLGVPLHAAVCFTDADWKIFARPFTIEDVLVAWPRALCERMLEGHRITPSEIEWVASELARGFRPKVAMKQSS